MITKNLTITETPRDGFQGLQSTIPTSSKIAYINLLLQCGFPTVEVGSLVSPKAIPQMADTSEVLKAIDKSTTNSQVAVLVATEKAGLRAMSYDVVDQLFFPFSTSETFLYKNIRQTAAEAESCIDALQNICIIHNKTLIVFFSLGFGNPYGDPWNIDLLSHWIEKMKGKGLTNFPISDIMGEASPEVIFEVYSQLKANFPELDFGLHLHALHHEASNKVHAAYKAGIRHFDTVMKGMGGCPMTGKELVGNLSLQTLMAYCENANIPHGLNEDKIREAEAFYMEHFDGIG